jgi:hypothetical protein
MAKTKSDASELEGGAGTSIHRPTSTQCDRSLIDPYKQAVRDELRRNVKIRVGNKTEIMSFMQANIRLLCNAALDGDRRAQLELLALYRADSTIDLKRKEYEFKFTLPPGFENV